MKRILVIGDAISDLYLDYSYKKQCPDDPAVPAYVLQNIQVVAGGAANVAVNLSALLPEGYRVDLISVIDTKTAATLDDSAVEHCVFVPRRRALIKERVKVDWGPLVRLDNRSTFEKDDVDKVHTRVKNYLAEVDPELVLISDYAGGVLTDDLISILRPFAHKCLVDTKRVDMADFNGFLLAKVNSLEYSQILSRDPFPERYFKFFVVTRGEMGARILSYRNYDSSAHLSPCHLASSISSTTSIPGQSVEAVDACGCGDTFLAGLAAGWVRFKGDPFESVAFANSAAATVVTQPKVAIADIKKTLEMIGRSE